MVQTLHDRTVGNVRLALSSCSARSRWCCSSRAPTSRNLLLVRGAARRNEMAVRTALGARQGRLLSYLLAESLVLAAAGGDLGLLLAGWGIDALKALAPANLPTARRRAVRSPGAGLRGARRLRHHRALRAWSGAAGVARDAGVRAPSANRRSAPRRRAGRDRRSWSPKSRCSLVLLLGAGLLLRSLQSMQHTDLGFESRDLSVFTLSLPPARYPADRVVDTHERLDADLAALPVSPRLPGSRGCRWGPARTSPASRAPINAPPPGQGPGALYRHRRSRILRDDADPGAAGRVFQPTDRANAQPRDRHQPAPGRHLFPRRGSDRQADAHPPRSARHCRRRGGQRAIARR